MKSKEIISLILIHILAVSLMVILPINVSASDNQISLLYTKVLKQIKTRADGSEYFTFTLSGDIAVPSQPTHSVIVHYVYLYGYIDRWNGRDETWQDASTRFVCKTADNDEVWHFEIDSPAYELDPYSYGKSTGGFKFAIKHIFNNTEYWDNNHGENYCVSTGYYPTCAEYVLNKAIVILDRASVDSALSGEILNGSIVLKNLGYQKAVKVHYTTNNWVTSQEASAKYGYTKKYRRDVYSEPMNMELWFFSIRIPLNSTQVKLKVSYTVNDVTYWDDNYGTDYVVNVRD